MIKTIPMTGVWQLLLLIAISHAFSVPSLFSTVAKNRRPPTITDSPPLVPPPSDAIRPTSSTAPSDTSNDKDFSKPKPFLPQEQHLKQDRNNKRGGKTAMILNVNARSVTPAVVETARQVFGHHDVFVTRTPQQAAAAARQIILDNNNDDDKKHYSLVVPVGGDGTLSSVIQYLCEAVMQQEQYPHNSTTTTTTTTTTAQAMKRLPVMAYLPMGTGNGVGSVVGCHNNNNSQRKGGWKRFVPLLSRRYQQQELLAKMQRLKAFAEKQEDEENQPSLPFNNSNDQEYELIEMPMIQVTHQHSNDDATTTTATTTNGENKSKQQQDDLCFFAGVGFDSLMLNDFKEIKAWSQRTGILRNLLSSVTGYCVALLARTLPQCIHRQAHKIQVDLVAHDPQTLWVDHRRGDFVRPVAAEGSSSSSSSSTTTSPLLLYSGTTGILCAGTSPYYGGGLRLFPFARMTTDQMHLRVGRIRPLTGFFRMPQIFAGSYRDKSATRFGCLDFMGRDFEVQVSPAVTTTGGKTTNCTSSTRSGGYPFQHSGESVGLVDRFRLRVVEEPVRFVCF